MDSHGSESPTLSATSAQKKSGMSITLPRNFAPLSMIPSEAPRTPDQIFAMPDLPPPPAYSMHRIRRPRLDMNHFSSGNPAFSAGLFASEIPVPSSAGPFATDFSAPLDISSDDPMPSIEISDSSTRPAIQHTNSEPCASSRLKLRPLEYEPSTPKTPLAQTTATPVNLGKISWDLPRPASVCSHRSDSSLSTTETFETRPTSFDGSIASPVDDKDPFSPAQNINIIPATPSRKSKKLRLASILSKDKANWTTDMDNHLFNVYQMYLQDPTVTPFKTVAGAIPPTGVCHRVARRARDTWPRASRIDVPIVKRYKIRSLLDVSLQPRDRTPDPDDFLTTDNVSRRNPWPSESSTRKRLKQLCREKFTIGKYYDRMRESRSPSPFAEQFLPRKSRLSRSPQLPDDDTPSNPAYTTRELGISLVASGATEPLAQLVTGDSPPTEHPLDDFNATPSVSEDIGVSTRQTASNDTGLGIHQVADRLAPAAMIPRLASPFSYNTWGGASRTNKHHRRYVSSNHFDTIHATGPRLLSPFQADASLNVNKRRAQHNLEDELSPSGSSLAGHASGLKIEEAAPIFPLVESSGNDLIFSGMGDISQRRVRLRNRGVTMGTAHERVARLFTPPVSDPQAETSAQPQLDASAMGGNMLLPPRLSDGQRRLGSPFELDNNKRTLKTRPSRHLPSLSDPFIQFTHDIPSSSTNYSTHNGIENISERLATFNQNFLNQRQQY